MTFLFEDINSIDNILTHSGLLQFLSAGLNELMFLVYFRLKAYQPYIYWIFWTNLENALSLEILTEVQSQHQTFVVMMKILVN